MAKTLIPSPKSRSIHGRPETRKAWSLFCVIYYVFLIFLMFLLIDFLNYLKKTKVFSLFWYALKRSVILYPFANFQKRRQMAEAWNPFFKSFKKGVSLCIRLATLRKTRKPLQRETPFFECFKKGFHSRTVGSFFGK